MPGNSINDWSIELGFDSSKVDKGLTRIEKRLAKLDKSRSKTARARKVSPSNLVGDERGSVVRAGNQLSAANALERKRQSMEASIIKGRSLKVGTAIAERNLSSSDPQVIEKARLSLIKRIKVQEERITAERNKQAKANRPGQITLGQRMTQESRIGRVQSEAGFAQKSLAGRTDEKSVALKRQLGVEVRRLNTAQKNLANTTFTNTKKYEKLRRSINTATQNVRNLKTEIKGLKRVGGGAGGGGIIGQIANSFTRLGVAAVSAYAVMAGGRALFESIKRLDSLKASMLAASGSAGQAKIDFEFVRESAFDLGRDLFTSAKGFQAIGAAMRGSFTQGQTKDVFLAASEASTAFGLSMDDTAGVMRAFSQIASKGTVQAEELRGQLGDRLPGAFQIAATAMNMTTDELNKMLKAGKVLSKDFLPKFAAELRKTVRSSGALAAGLNTVVAAQNRMNLAMTESSERLGESGGKEIFKDIFKIITKIVKFLTPIGEAFVKILAPLVKHFGEFVDMVFDVLTPIAETVSLFAGLLGSLIELGASTGLWADRTESVNKELDKSIEKMSILKRIFEFIAGVLQVIQGGVGVATTLASGAIDELVAAREGRETKRVKIKGGQMVSEFEANMMETRDRLFARLPFMDPQDTTGRIAKGNSIVQTVTATIEINEATDPDLVSKEIDTGIQDGLSAAIPADQ